MKAAKRAGDVRSSARPPECRPTTSYLMCLLTSLVISNIETFALAAEHRLELVVGVDHATLLRVLQAVLLDVGPELLRDLGPRNRIATDDRGERRVWLLRRHERRIRLALLRRPSWRPSSRLPSSQPSSRLLRAALLGAALLGGLLCPSLQPFSLPVDGMVEVISRRKCAFSL